MDKKCTIFYSWQSDIKPSRNFISDCLRNLPKKLEHMALCEIDRDTQGLAGAPDIGDSIYEKIDRADIFIADVTIINPDYAGRPTPNPNVLIELGYAIKALGWDRIILLYDKDMGEIEDIPFDINHRRIVSFSLQGEGEKAGIRGRLLSCIVKTIEILDREHRLHGGSAETVKAQKTLRQLLQAGLERVWAAYAESEKTDRMDLYDTIPPVSEAQLALVDQTGEALSEEQYRLAHTILFHMRMSRLGNDDMYGWEFANRLAPQCFEPLYIEYAARICELPVVQILQKPALELLNALSFEETIPYEERRLCGGKLVFSTAADEYYACDVAGKTLCQGRMDADGFTGFKHTEEQETEYEGEYVRDKKHGQGKEYACGADAEGQRTLLREGRWENGRFAEGTAYGLLAQIKDGVPELLRREDGTPRTGFDWDYLFGLRQDAAGFWLVDARFQDGDYAVIAESKRKAFERE